MLFSIRHENIAFTFVLVFYNSTRANYQPANYNEFLGEIKDASYSIAEICSCLEDARPV